MRLKRLIFLLIAFIFLIPFVKAETCEDCSDIRIDSVELYSTWGASTEESNPTISDNKVDVDVKLSNVNDEVEYKLTIRNTSKTDVTIDDALLKKETDYIEYEYTYEGSNVILSGEEKTVILKIKYVNKVPKEELENDAFNITDKIPLGLEKGDITNPKTGIINSIIYVVFAAVCIGALTIVYKKENAPQKIAVIVGLLLIPLTVKAVCECKIEVNANITIDAKEATFDTGEVVNEKMKRLAGDTIVENAVKTGDENIAAIRKSETEPMSSNKETKNIVSSSTSPYPIYMWFEDGIIYWWSEDDTPSMNEDASYMFARLYSLSDTSGLRNIDTSMTISMRALFGNSSSLENADDLKYWNTSNVENLYYLFGTAAAVHNEGHVNHIKDITALKYWDVSKVTDMGSMLQNAVLLETLDGLETWDTSSLTNMKNIFGGTLEASLIDIKAISNWNTSNVISMQWLLENQVKLTDIEALRNWDVSNVEHMGGLFAGSKETGMHIKNFEPISGWNTHSATTFQYIFQQENDLETAEFFKNWDTSSVTEMLNAFAYCRGLKTLNGLENWDVSKATTLNGMFSNTESLEDASAINDWNISSTADLTSIFSNSPVKPEFTKISGTWNGGTFVVNN